MGTGSQQAPTIVVPIGTVVQRDSFGSRMLDGGVLPCRFPGPKEYTSRLYPTPVGAFGMGLLLSRSAPWWGATKPTGGQRF